MCTPIHVFTLRPLDMFIFVHTDIWNQVVTYICFYYTCCMYFQYLLTLGHTWIKQSVLSWIKGCIYIHLISVFCSRSLRFLSKVPCDLAIITISHVCISRTWTLGPAYSVFTQLTGLNLRILQATLTQQTSWSSVLSLVWPFSVCW